MIADVIDLTARRALRVRAAQTALRAPATSLGIRTTITPRTYSQRFNELCLELAAQHPRMPCERAARRVRRQIAEEEAAAARLREG